MAHVVEIALLIIATAVVNGAFYFFGFVGGRRDGRMGIPPIAIEYLSMGEWREDFCPHCHGEMVLGILPPIGEAPSVSVAAHTRGCVEFEGGSL